MDQFEAWKQAKTRADTMDLTIASVCLATSATLLTRNTRDFNQVKGLKVEDWLA